MCSSDGYLCDLSEPCYRPVCYCRSYYPDVEPVYLGDNPAFRLLDCFQVMLEVFLCIALL